MELIEKIKSGKTRAVAVLGVAGLLLIIISSVLPEKKQSDQPAGELNNITSSGSVEYCRETEKKLEEFLEKIDGAGDVEVYLTVKGSEKYVYTAEEKKVKSENKTEEEEKYVIVGGGSEREPLIETIEAPEITGAVIICTGGESPVVEERIYKAVSSALGISTGRIYVTKMK